MKRKVHIKAGNHMFRVRLLCKRKVTDNTNYISYTHNLTDKSMICKDCLRKIK